MTRQPTSILRGAASSARPNRLHVALGAALAVTISLGAQSAVAQNINADVADALPTMPPLPATPLAALDVLLVRPFVLAQPYTNEWRAERPDVIAGVLLVVDLPPDATVPRQVAEPVLMVGDRVAERLHVAWPNGRAVIIVPAEVGRDGKVILPLEQELIYFASPQLPERVDAAWIAVERDAALAAGIAPLPTERIGQARRRGGETLQLADRRALIGAAARLIKEFVPDQDEAAETLLLNAMTE